MSPISLLPPQEEVFYSSHRLLWLLWRRQLGKSHTFANKALSRMMSRKNHSIFVLNASLLMGQENILKEATVWASVLDWARATHAGLDVRETTFKTVEHRDKTVTISETKSTKLPDKLDPKDLVGIFESSKLEARIWHDRTNYSRTRVVAPNPLTARGFTGDVFGDEVAFWPEFELVMDAVEPIITRNPEFVMWMATTPSADESHPTFDLLMPRLDFTANARGNWYETEDGTPVHRCDSRDSDLCGVPAGYGRDKQPLKTAEAREQARNKKNYDRNYLLKFVSGGQSAIARHQLIGAQTSESAPCGMALDFGALDDLDDAT
jgi:hypothetical protein